jgi:transposase-like protein
MEVRIMRADPVPAEEQYWLIMECRASGMTDYQWCTEHGIKPGTFYNWVKRLRKSGCTDIPAAVRHCRPDRQEIVQISFNKPAESLHPDLSAHSAEVVWETPCPTAREANAMELTMSGASLRIPNGTDPVLLKQTIRLLKGMSC